ncbi:MAG TPA: hypothetical protein VF535_07395 [Allosphingosinicella sp.]|jgi:hypothetical protein
MGCSSAAPGAKARIANPALKPLEFLVGEWSTEGAHPAGTAETLRGRTSFSWHEGGAFLIMRSRVEHDQFPDGIAVIIAGESGDRLESKGRMSERGGDWADDLSQVFVRLS